MKNTLRMRAFGLSVLLLASIHTHVVAQSYPGGVNGAVVWLKADQGVTTSGSNVTSWVNQAGGTNFTGAGNPQWNANQLNFQPGILFNGNNQVTSNASILTNNGAYTKFVVFKYDGLTANNLISSGAGGNHAIFSSNTNTDLIVHHGGNILIANNVVTPARYYLATAGFSSGAANGTYINVDGALKKSTTSSAPYNAGLIQLGAHGNGNNLTGRIAEAIVYPTALATAANATRQIQTYLGLKYGISLSHDYLASNAGTVYDVSSFGNNIAGLGRDDNSSLHQKQAVSINGGHQLIMSLGAIAATNLANAGTIATDRQFLVWGNDNGALNTTAALTGWTNTTTRLTRIWKLQNTGSFNQQVTVYFPVAGLNALPGSNPYLIYNTSNTLNGGGTEVASSGTTTINGVAYRSYQLTFPATGTLYFSFAAKLVNPGDIAGASVWLRADAGLVTSGNNVVSWTNQVNAANSFTATGNPQLTPANVNFNQGILFNNSRLNSAGNTLMGNSPYTKFVVFKYDAVNGNNLVSSPAGGNNAFFGAATATDVALWHNGTILNAANSVNTSRYFIATGGFTRSLTGGTYINVDGVSRGTATSTAPYVTSGTELGSHNGGGSPLSGRIAEVIIFPSSLGNNTDNTRKIESYLGLKYGITIGHDYLTTDGTVTYTAAGFGNNIAGIGRDDKTALYQKQGRSINAGTPQVLMAINEYAGSNQSNTGVIPADQQFLIWGNDNGAVTTTTGLTGWTITNTRLSRIWKMQNTGGFNQQVTVYFPVSGLNNLPGTNPYLIYNTSATLTGGGTEVAASTTVTIDGAVWKGFTVTFPNTGNLYFSFASKAVNPGNVAGAAVWLRPDAGLLTTGNNVTGWVNQSNTGNSFTAAANPQQVANNINFHPGVVFNGANYITSANTVLPANTNYTKFVVFKYDAVNTNNIVSSGPGGNNAFFGANTATDLHIFHAGNILSATNVVNSSRYFIGTAGYASGVAAGTFINVDGANRASGTSSQAYVASLMQLGAHGNANNLSGRVAELIVYPSALASGAAETRQIQSYLGLKYGISIGHNYLASDGTTVTYDISTHNNNIAGIGRDDEEGLNQLQGRSINTGTQQVVMALGSIANSNAENLNSFTADKQWLVWGDNNGAVSTTVPVTGFATVNNRFARIWKLQNTGNMNQEVTVYFPTAQLNQLTNADKYLIYNTSATLAGPGTEVLASGTATIGGVAHTAFTLTFPTTGTLYFSFASKAIFPGGVTGAAVWLRSDAGVNTTGTAVNNWINQTNTSNNFTATGNIQLSPAAVNFNPSMIYDGSSFLSSAANVTTNANGNYTKFVVFRAAEGAGGRNLMSAYSGAPGTALYATNKTLRVLHSATGVGTMTEGSLNTGKQYLGTMVFSNGTANGTLLRQDGVTGVAVTSTLSHSIDRLQIGAYNSTNQISAGSNIAEAVMYNTALDAASYGKVESYLALKYGITLGADYTATDNSTVYSISGYGNSIAGIGRDDNTGLNQRQSQSVNPGSQVVMAIGEVAATNADNSNAITSDLQFLVWGDDNAPGFNYNTGISQKRLARTWKLQNTNNFDQALTVYYPITGLNGLGPAPMLIYGTSASLDDGSAAQVTAGGTVEINGETFRSFTITFPNTGTQYFSFAGRIEPEICGNGIDDDLDGYTDDLDDACAPIPGCTAEAPPLTNFSISQEWLSTTNNALAASVSPTVADLDGDGMPEILAVRAGGLGITYFKGDGSDAGKNSVDYNIQLPIRVTQSTMQPAVADIDRDGLPEVIVVANDAYVYVFNNVSGNANNYKFKSADTVTTKFRNGSPRIADIDEDGIPEIIVGLDVFQFNFGENRLIKAVTGTADLPAGYTARLTGVEWGTDMVVIDILASNPGKEIVAGSRVYGVDLHAGTLTTLANLSTIAGAAVIPLNDDGPTAVADLDYDGQLDIAYPNGTYMVIWDPAAGALKMRAAYPNNGQLFRGAPTIANIYNEQVIDGAASDLPEVLFNSNLRMHAFNLNKTSGPVWSLVTADGSSETGVTAFDLNGDGILEIIYNDEDLIRVVNGNSATPANIASFTSGTATWMEHPVVVDADNDGAAEFVCVSGPPSAFTGNLRVFGATNGTTPWQNTRKIWNGRGYRPKSISDDLSIPVKEQSIMLQYPAGSGKFPLDVFNAQVDPRLLDPGIIAASDLSVAELKMPSSETSCEFQPASASLIFTISNNGSAAAPSGTPIRFYLGDPRKAGAIRLSTTRELAANLPVGNTVKDTVTLDLSGQPAPYSIYVVTNDDGSATIPFNLPIAAANSKECEYNNNIDSIVIAPVPADFGNLDATWPAASASIRTVDAVWLGIAQPNSECAAVETDGADGLVMTSGHTAGNGSKTSPWIMKGIDTEAMFTLTVNGSGVAKPVYYGVWYDVDGNGSFTDALDLFTSGSLAHGSPVATNFSFLVPPAIGATTGAIRVIATAVDPGFTKAMNGEGNFVNGEVEDYFINYTPPLPITLTDFSATPTANCTVHLKWSTSMEANSSHYDVQLYDGKEFQTIATVPSNNIETGSHYSFTHNIAGEGDVSYRLKHYDIDGKFQLSRIVTAKTVCTNVAIRILPNPVVETTVISGLKAADRILIYNADGKLVMEAKAGGYSYTLNLKKLPAGMYMAQIIRNGIAIKIEKVVKM